jgi:hypothetical protein
MPYNHCFAECSALLGMHFFQQAMASPVRFFRFLFMLPLI